MRHITLLAMIFGLVGVAGHAGAQEAAKPDTTSVERDREALKAARESADRQLRNLKEKDGTSIEEAVRQAIATAPQIDLAQAAVDDARAGAKQAMSALVPRLDLEGTYTRLSDVSNPDIGGFTFPVFLDRWSFIASATYSITGSLAQALPEYRAARVGKDGARWQVVAERNLIALQAHETYFEYARAKAALRVALASLGQTNAEYKDVSTLVGAGAAAYVDLVRVQARQAAAEVAVARAKQGEFVSQQALRTLLHVEGPVEFGEDLSLPVTDVPDSTLEELEERAYSERPDLVAIDRLIKSRTRTLRAAKATQAPELLVQANAQYQNPNSRIIPQTQEFNSSWDVSAVLRWSPNDTLSGNGTTTAARADLRRVQADLIALQDAVRVEVARGYHGMIAARAASEAAAVGLRAAEESYRVRREQLSAGVVNSTDLLVAEAELTQARLDLVDAAVGLRIARAALLHAIGVQP